MSLRDFSLEIIGLIEKGKIRDKAGLNKWKQVIAKKHSLHQLPTNPDILSFVPKRTQKLVELLGKKPSRTLSGIAVAAIMTAPHKCPGECIYCPNSLVGERTPKSYTGREPATMRALRSGFDPAVQVNSRLSQLEQTGHSTEKVELIVMGGTFLSQKKSFQEGFITKAINAVAESRARSLKGAKKKAETSRRRITGITFETRPDYCSKMQVKRMLYYGGTRCELGVQILDDAVYKKIRRKHSVADVANATQNLKDAGFKVAYHFMPGLPGSTEKKDFELFEKAFLDQRFKPDMVKLYPCLVIKGTALYKKFKRGEFKPLSTGRAAELIASMKKIVPPWTRIMRVQRDIPAQLIEAGVKKGNLRQLAIEELSERGEKCNCIRCREAGLNAEKAGKKKARLFIDEYRASNGLELFISLESPGRKTLYGFCRLRIPEKSFIKEISGNNAIVRELRVFGKALPLHIRESESAQHRGLGSKLLSKAEELASDCFDKKGLAVISGLGVREYYRNHGYSNLGEYLYKKL